MNSHVYTYIQVFLYKVKLFYVNTHIHTCIHIIIYKLYCVHTYTYTVHIMFIIIRHWQWPNNSCNVNVTKKAHHCGHVHSVSLRVYTCVHVKCDDSFPLSCLLLFPEPLPPPKPLSVHLNYGTIRRYKWRQSACCPCLSRVSVSNFLQ